MKKIFLILFSFILFCIFQLFGCAFDVVHVKQIPANFIPAEQDKESWKLLKEVNVTLSSGYNEKLKSETKWDYIGKVEQGDVFKTEDQILTVEGSNIFEAYLVVSNGYIKGFYLPVEKTFSPLSSPKKLEMEILLKD